MAATYGIVRGRSRTPATRCGGDSITATVKSWRTAVTATVYRDGKLWIEVRDIELGQTLAALSIDTPESEDRATARVMRRDSLGRLVESEPLTITRGPVE